MVAVERAIASLKGRRIIGRFTTLARKEGKRKVHAQVEGATIKSDNAGGEGGDKRTLKFGPAICCEGGESASVEKKDQLPVWGEV